MKVYLVRHGQTKQGEDELHQEHGEKLSVNGLAQAKSVALRFSDIKIDAIYASPASRADTTAREINLITKSEFITTPLLKEIAWPTAIQNKAIKNPEVIKIKEEIMAKWDDANWRHSDEETFFEARTRILQFVELLNNEQRDVLVVSHARTIKLLTGILLFGKDLSPAIYKDIMWHFRITLTGLTIFEKGSRGWLMKTWNDYAHLGEDVGEDFYK